MISAIIIFLNGLPYLDEAIASVFAQTHDDWELLLVDDGSTDGSTEVARGWAARHPGRVRYFEHDGHRNRGMSASRNVGFAHARGVYVALLDADDVWLPEKFARNVAQMAAHPDAGMLLGKTEYWRSWTGRVEDAGADDVPEHGLVAGRIYHPPELFTLLYPVGHRPAPCICSLLTRLDAVRRVGGFEEAFTGFYEDQAFLTKIYLSTPVLVVDDCLDRYRIHGASCSAVVSDAGTYARYRQQYFDWLARYLATSDAIDAAVKEAALRAMPAPGDGDGAAATSRWVRLFRVADDNAAELTVDAEDGEKVRIAIAKARTAVTHHIQLNLSGLPLTAGRRYELGFLARADRDRVASVGVALGHEPWTNAGLYEAVTLDSGWRRFVREFISTTTDPDARIHFDLGGSEVSVDLSGVTLFDLERGTAVLPAQPTPAEHGTPGGDGPVAVGAVDFGSLRRLTPISRNFGFDRGRPVDRHYIERFLAAHSADIRGRVLEVGERTYTRRYGGAGVTSSDVLHVSAGAPEATIIADLTDAAHIPAASFDCVILTQTLQLIYDTRAAVATLARILAPSGVVLATMPGITQIQDGEWGGVWCWSFTPLSAGRLFRDAFDGSVEVGAHGNVFSAVAFLHGIAAEELAPAELNRTDAGYPVTITVRAARAAR